MFECFESKNIPTGEAIIHAVIGGSGPPLLLLHGYPQTHVMWHRIAPGLVDHFTVIASDLRGYGDSSKPASDPAHLNYCKRVTARDQVEIMEMLGFRHFFVAGHDRGGRVGHRMALDHSDRVEKLAVLDIVPTHKLFSAVNKDIATGYYHWFFLIQGDGLPETMIGHDPGYYLRTKLRQWSANLHAFDSVALKEYIRCFSDPACIHASCEDYRAAASIDLAHDEADMDRKLRCPVLVLWGEKGLMERHFDVPGTWRERALDVRGRKLACGHFLAEEKPEETLSELLSFFLG